VNTRPTVLSDRKRPGAPEFDRAAETALRRYGGTVENRGGGAVVVLPAALPGPERETLERRRGELAMALMPAAVDEAARMVIRLFRLITLATAEEGELRALVADYAAALATEPLFAIAGACRAVVDRGDRFRPGLPELLALARKAAAGARRELRRIELTLTAEVEPPPGPEERARVLAGFRALRRELAEREAAPAAEAAPSSGASRHLLPRAGEGTSAA